MKVCTTCSAEYGDDQLFCQRDGTPLRKSGASTDLVGQVIADRYHITKKLGEGGMGQVYLAEHVKMGRRCAIKIMTQSSMSDPDAISRFNREAANASRINHANVCAIYDFGETSEGLIYLAMELIEGKSLTDLLEEVGTLPLARAGAMIQQSADGLQVAHDLGIVHRDLKPDNIMVTTARGKDTVKVVDFGIAKAVGGDESNQKVTKTGFVVGTPEYMSPEQLAGDPVDGRSDLYSLGLVFYRMLTGATPFPADSQQETMIKRLTDDPLTLAEARPDTRFPAELQRVMDRVLARNPGERYQSAAEFGREVKAVAQASTGLVDAEAGTQVVRAEDLKKAVPATRMDPVVGRRTPPAPAAPGTASQPVAKPRGSFPVVPVAAGVVVLALGGGAFALKDTLFGRTAQDSVQTPIPQKPDSTRDTSRVAGGTTNPGTNPGGTTTTQRDTSRGGTQVVRPPPPNTGRDSARPPQPEKINVELPSLDDVFEASTRPRARQDARTIYNRSDVKDSVRAEAASLVGQSYNEDKDFREAARWFGLALALNPRTLYQQLKADAERNLRSTQPN